MDSLEIIRTIISEPPKAANSIQLEFSDIENNITSKELFELLLMMFTESMKVLYGENGRVELSKISRNNFNRINEYFNSFGFTINYEILPENDTTKIDYVEKKELKDYYMRLKSNNLLYIISFDFYICNTMCK